MKPSVTATGVRTENKADHECGMIAATSFPPKCREDLTDLFSSPRTQEEKNVQDHPGRSVDFRACFSWIPYQSRVQLWYGKQFIMLFHSRFSKAENGLNLYLSYTLLPSSSHETKTSLSLNCGFRFLGGKKPFSSHNHKAITNFQSMSFCVLN